MVDIRTRVIAIRRQNEWLDWLDSFIPCISLPSHPGAGRQIPELDAIQMIQLASLSAAMFLGRQVMQPPVANDMAFERITFLWRLVIHQVKASIYNQPSRSRTAMGKLSSAKSKVAGYHIRNGFALGTRIVHNEGSWRRTRVFGLAGEGGNERCWRVIKRMSTEAMQGH